MLFNSVEYILFFTCVVVIYYIIPSNRFRKIFLLLASCYYYACWNVAFLSILLLVALTTFVSAILIERNAFNSKRKGILITSIIIVLTPLICFKYLNFVLRVVNDLIQASNASINVRFLDILQPVGISFFTFIAIGYVIDVYKKQLPVEKNLLDYFLFVGFFPQISAGPIARASQLLPQFKKTHRLQYENVSGGVKMMLWGFFMKLVVGDRAGIYVDTVFGNWEMHNGTSLIIATFLYTMQIYCDFAGYSLIAIGCARVLGFKLMDNFNRPYFATSVTEFWRRWHISLSTWFRDYLYIPLGGSRTGKWRTYRNLFITFLVSGLWHGAAYTFVIWGAYHGLLQILEKASKNLKIRTFSFLRISENGRTYKGINMLLTFALVSYGWMIFRAPDIHAVVGITTAYLDFGVPYIHPTTLLFFAIGFVILLIKDFRNEFYPNRYFLMDSRHKFVRILSYSALVSVIMVAGVLNGGQFIYFQF